MSEKVHHQEHNEHKPHPLQHQATHERNARGTEHTKKPEHDLQRSLESIRRSVEQHAPKTESMDDEIDPAEIAARRKDEAVGPAMLTRKVKKAAYDKTLRQTQKQLSVPERTFSRIIHQPAVDKVSTLAAKTVARPSGILAGGIGALVGSSLLYLVSKHYGFTYNFLISTLLFAGFYCGGLLIEVTVRLLGKRRQQS